MLKNKTLAILAAIALIASIAIASASASANGTNGSEEKPLCPFAGMRMGSGTGMHGMMAPDSEAMEAGMEERLAAVRERLNLSGDATMEEIQDAMKENMESLREERLNTIREKLGLPEEATEDEIETALQEWREENRDLIMGLGGPEPGMRRGPGFRGIRGFR